MICLHKFLGYHRAKLNWQICIDPDFLLKKTVKKRRLILKTKKRIDVLAESLKTMLNEDEFSQLLNECNLLETESRDSKESGIEIQHRPPNLTINKNAIFNMTSIEIPEDILIGLSFGYKFLFPYACTKGNMCEILAQLDLTVTQAVPDLKQLETTIDIYRTLKAETKIQNDSNKVWLSFIHLRIKQFFFKNKDIFATRSDKGGHTVVLSTEQYNDRLTIMLNDDSYQVSLINPLEVLISEEGLFIKKLKKDPSVAKLFKGLPLYEPQTLLLSKFYGLIKIHKKDFPLRPITAMIGSVGYLLGKVFNEMLNKVFPVTRFHIRDSYQFVRFLNKVRIKKNDQLVSFDVVSMFTSIPIDLVREIILSKSNKFFDEFSLNRADLNALIDFLLVECTYFTAQDKIFKQIKGLPMGSCISPTLARIVMDKIIRRLKADIPEISFIKVFVDDTVAAIDYKFIDKALMVLNNFMIDQIRFTKEVEESKSINFLNLTLKREEIFISPLQKEYIIITKWYRKSFASGRLLNFYSSHKRTTIVGTAVHFIKTVLTLSDPCFYNENRSLVEQTLKDNSFPETLILTLMQTHYTYMKPLINNEFYIEPFSFYDNFDIIYKQNMKTHSESVPVDKCNKLGQIENDEDSIKYVIFPHSVLGGREIKKAIFKNKKPGVVLADSVKNTKINSIRSIKTKTPLINKSNVIIMSKCQCNKKLRICATGFNETGLQARKHIITKRKECKANFHAYNKVKIKRGLFYKNQTNSFVKYLQWKHRKSLDTKYKYEFPTSRLIRLV